MKKGNSRVTIRPSWMILLILLLMILFFAYYYFTKTEFRLKRLNTAGGMLLICVGLFLYFSQSYSIEKGKFSSHILFIPVRTLPWHRIQQVLVFKKWNTGKRAHNITRTDPMIVITLWGIEPYDIHSNDIADYLSRHPVSTIQIPLHDGREEVVIEALQKYAKSVTIID